jgi:hypothetical protein
VAEVFSSIGYTPEKMNYLVNRVRLERRHRPRRACRALGRRPDFEVVSDGRLVVQANNEGMPFVVSSPDAAVSRDIGGWRRRSWVAPRPTLR